MFAMTVVFWFMCIWRITHFPMLL